MKLKKFANLCRANMHLYVMFLSDKVSQSDLLDCTANAVVKVCPDTVLNMHVLRIVEAEDDGIRILVGDNVD